jgi:hypothetical protein
MSASESEENFSSILSHSNSSLHAQLRDALGEYDNALRANLEVLGGDYSASLRSPGGDSPAPTQIPNSITPARVDPIPGSQDRSPTFGPIANQDLPIVSADSYSSILSPNKGSNDLSIAPTTAIVRGRSQRSFPTHAHSANGEYSYYYYETYSNTDSNLADGHNSLRDDYESGYPSDSEIGLPPKRIDHSTSMHNSGHSDRESIHLDVLGNVGESVVNSSPDTESTHFSGILIDDDLAMLDGEPTELPVEATAPIDRSESQSSRTLSNCEMSLPFDFIDSEPAGPLESPRKRS